MHCGENIRKYLGITLLPQAGVALGMAMTVQELGAEGSIIRNIVLFGVLIYELVGPLLTKIALTKAGDIHPKETAASSTTITTVNLPLTAAAVSAAPVEDEDDD